MIFKPKSYDKETLEKTWSKTGRLEKLGDVFWCQGRISKAVKLYKRAAKEMESTTSENGGNPSGDSFIRVARLYEKAGQIVDALRAYSKAEKAQLSGSKGYNQEKIRLGIKTLEERLDWLQDVTQRPKDSLTSYPSLLKEIRMDYRL